VGDSDVVT
jgi:hypothetical protein